MRAIFKAFIDDKYNITFVLCVGFLATRHVESLLPTRIKLILPALEDEVSTTGSPEKSLIRTLNGL